MGMTIDEFEEYAKSHNILTMTRELYENRLKDDMVAMLTELQLEIAELEEEADIGKVVMIGAIDRLIQQKINELKAESEDKE